MLPILFQNHDLIIYSYPLLMGLGWGVAYQFFFAKADIQPKYSQLLFWGIFISAWIGSKLFFYFTTSDAPSSLLSEASFWTGGGFVFYGGLIVALLYVGLYRLLKFPLSKDTIWAMLPALTLGHAIGRLGCLLAGCCYGAVTDWWWGIHLHGHDRHPTQALESAGLFLIAIYLIKFRHHLHGLSAYLISYGCLRFLVELLRGDAIRGQWGVLTPSQWISGVLILSGIILVIIKKSKGLQNFKA